MDYKDSFGRNESHTNKQHFVGPRRYWKAINLPKRDFNGNGTSNGSCDNSQSLTAAELEEKPENEFIENLVSR